MENRTGRRRRCKENDALILHLLAEARRPLSAYDIVEQTTLHGERMVAPQVYRTLARLIGQGAVRRIETLGAYALPANQGNVCLICRHCHGIEFIDVPGLDRAIASAGHAAGHSGSFDLAGGLIEAQGQCAGCQQEHHHA